MVIGEGSGIIILEELEFARNRGARIYAEVLGYGLNCDAHHITSPEQDGQGAADCIEMGLADAGITTDQVDYINAHGTSTYLNDLAETLAIKRVFKQRAKDIPISSTKSVTGHLWGSAAAVEAVFCTLTITYSIIPPTINYETQDPLCDLDYVPNEPRRTAVNVVLSNAFGFGGTNATLVLCKPPL
jgi:3-oxoacyl-[acyl-carrier-protein] synthase II